MFLNRRIVILLVSLICLVFVTGCKSKFEKLRASNNIAMKYQEAIKFYEKKKYTKALALFDDLMIKYRGQAEAEDLYYYTAYTNYRIKDYTSARYHFKQFAITYPNSPRAEECRFMSAYCYFVDSPRSTLDQENSRKAIDELQLFVNLYPDSERAKEASDLIQKLRDKLEIKAFENAKLYYKFLMFKSQYLFAVNSYVNRQEIRFNEAIDYYDSFVEHYPESKYKKEADNIRENTNELLATAIKRVDQINKERERQIKEMGTKASTNADEETVSN